jgi:hypothetical protein
LIDTSHSATMLDLPYESHLWKVIEVEKASRIQADVVSLFFSVSIGDLGPKLTGYMSQISISSCPDGGEVFDSPDGGLLVQFFCKKMRQDGILRSNQGIEIRNLVEYIRLVSNYIDLILGRG